MALVSDIPIIDLIKEIENKHGEDTHMVIEVVVKDEKHSNIDEDHLGNLDEKDILWWVEFKNEQKVFDNFAMVRHYFLNEVDSNDTNS